MDVLMITGLQHISLSVADLEAGILTYTSLLGRAPSMRCEQDGDRSAYFALGNMTLRIVSPSEQGSAAERARRAIRAIVGVPYELSFRVADIDKERQRLKMISLWPEKVQELEVRDNRQAGSAALWRVMKFKDRPPNAIDIQFVEVVSPITTSQTISEAPVLGAELVVIKTAAPEQALALYGARLGLALVFDRTIASTGNRLAQFSCGNVMLEISCSEADAGKPDTIWGIGWSVASAEATHRRLAVLGRNLSDVRDGTRPGTRVFTVRDGTCGIPTIFVENTRTP